MNIQLPTGKTITMSVYEFYFVLKEDEVDEFYRSCIADDLGTEINHPFSDKRQEGKLEVEEIDIEDISL